RPQRADETAQIGRFFTLPCLFFSKDLNYCFLISSFQNICGWWKDAEPLSTVPRLKPCRLAAALPHRFALNPHRAFSGSPTVRASPRRQASSQILSMF
ncbi:MAG: hypothetical protein LBP78_04800, partial [Acidaminococcales bacterium]|nr:hypothetical protein [Acidaminococcales bacterium]